MRIQTEFYLFQWSIPVPKCLAPCIIPQFDYGVASEPVGEKVTHGEEITVNCTENYEVERVGQPIRCDNGRWTQMPVCVPARCKTMPVPPQGRIHFIRLSKSLDFDLKGSSPDLK